MFREKLKEIRKREGITQQEAARRLGVSLGAVGNWESGKRTPDAEMLGRIADTFGVSVDYLLGREEDEGSVPTELDRCIEQLKKRPELVNLLSLTRNASQEDIQRVIRVIEAMIV
ncbi:MAG: helix-turn-helix domain-containing protein [Eubacteriales bacterium]